MDMKMKIGILFGGVTEEHPVSIKSAQEVARNLDLDKFEPYWETDPLDESKTYRVATNDFMARGGDGYTMFRDAPRVLAEADAPTVAAEVMEYIKSTGTLRTGVQGRIAVR